MVLSRKPTINCYIIFCLRGYFFLTLYWQIIPILMVSTGMSLDLRKLVAYPIPQSQLFAIEVLLRITTAGEMLLMLCGALIGLLRNPKVSFWAPWTLVIYIAFNLLLSVGLRDLLARVLARKKVSRAAHLSAGVAGGASADSASFGGLSFGEPLSRLRTRPHLAMDGGSPPGHGRQP